MSNENYYDAGQVEKFERAVGGGKMSELIDFRNTLISEINAGWYDALSWQACAVWAREIGCAAIQSQVEGYISHYGNTERWL